MFNKETPPSAVPTSVAAPPRPRTKRWRVALALLAFLIVALVGAWFYLDQAANRDWEQAVAETDALDPRWRLEELEADRPVIPEAENSAPRISAVAAKSRAAWVFRAPAFESLFVNLPPTAQLNDQQIQIIGADFAKVGKAREEARQLKDFPRGRFGITLAPDGGGHLLPQVDSANPVSSFLKYDAYMLAQDEKYEEAAETCMAILNTSRSLHGEPYAVSFNVRVHIQLAASIALERVLAQGQLADRTLQTLQSALENESKESSSLSVLRGERAVYHDFLDNVRTGKTKLSSQTGAGPASVREWLDDTFPSRPLRYYPDLLRHMNRHVEIAKLPIHERGIRLGELELDAEKWRRWPDEPKVPFPLKTRLLRAYEFDCRGQGTLRSAAVALACERYRLRHKDSRNENPWPASLDVLVQEKLLDGIPLDPMDGQPIRYLRTKDGIVVYSIGLDRTDNKGHIDHNRAPTDPGLDIGFRLWNVDRRRQPPLPPVKLDDGE